MMTLYQKNGDTAQLDFIKNRLVYTIETDPRGGGFTIVFMDDNQEEEIATIPLEFPGASRAICESFYEKEILNGKFSYIDLMLEVIGDDIAYFIKTGKYHIDEDSDYGYDTFQTFDSFDLVYHATRWNEQMLDFAIQKINSIQRLQMQQKKESANGGN